MAIGSADEKRTQVYVYDEAGRILFIRNGGGGGGAKDGIVGYTGTSITIRTGNVVVVYDEKGRQISRRVAH